MAESSLKLNGQVEQDGGGDLVDHVGIVVRDIDASLAFYQGLLGFVPFGDESLPEVGVRVVYLDSDQSGSTTLQLVQPTKSGPLQDFLDTEGDGLHHICLAVDDIPDALDRLAPGATVRIVIGGRGRRACFLPELREGVRIELTEIEPWAARQAARPGREEEEGR